MGPMLGPIGIMTALPMVCYGLIYACNSRGCLEISSLSLPGFPAHSQLISIEALLAILGWVAFQTILHVALPGQHVQGALLPSRERLTYKLNGGFLCCDSTLLSQVVENDSVICCSSDKPGSNSAGSLDLQLLLADLATELDIRPISATFDSCFCSHCTVVCVSVCYIIWPV